MLHSSSNDNPAGAVLSPCTFYRYRLWRTWDAGRRPVAFIGLNPSTADATKDDPTIRRCIGFAKAWGFGGMAVVNLFAYRATRPHEMMKAEEPVGSENDAHIRESVGRAARVVAAWGVRGQFRMRNVRVLEMLEEIGITVYCLKKTKGGHPQHPLYVRKNGEPVELG